jgi:hypothetical protein
LLDYGIKAGKNYYDPNNISDYVDGSMTGLRYQFNLLTNGAKQPSPEITSKWSLFFDSNSQNTIRDTYKQGNDIYLSSLQTPNTPESNVNNEYITNWFSAGNSNIKEMYLNPAVVAGGPPSFNNTIGDPSIFLTCTNYPSMTADVSTSATFSDVSGINGVSFFLPPSDNVKLNTLLIKFVYAQASQTSVGVQYNRTNSPNDNFAIGDSALNQTSHTNTNNSAIDEWDDWYLYNRRNLKIGIFNTSNINTMPVNSLELTSAVCTLTLDAVTQVNNYRNQYGTKRTREPEWGTYYKYKFEPIVQELWDVKNVNWTGGPANTYWKSTIVTADFSESTTMADTTYENYFHTPDNIVNYTYLPRSYGIAPSVGNSVNPLADIPNSYTAVPFYYDQVAGKWKVGSFRGISYTRAPVLPSSDIIGAAPYSGPAGIYAFNDVGGVFNLYNGDMPSFKPYYWNIKMQYEVLYVKMDPATDLELFGGLSGVASEYQDTMLYIYSNKELKDDLIDVSTNTATWIWGMESNANYSAFDDQDGYNFLSYIHDVSVRSKFKEYALHVRAYDPIPRFNTGIRFIGKNVTDFGRPSLGEIAEEISTLGKYTPISDISGSYFSYLLANSNDSSLYNSTISTNNAYRSTNTASFSHEYADALMNFNTTFITNVTFGKKTGFNGMSFAFDGFPSTIANYVTNFSSIRGTIEIYTTILSTASSELNAYVVERYSNILPPAVLERNRLTDPLPYQFLFQSKLEPPYTDLYDEWGLGYNLGFVKKDTYPPRTTVTSDTFIKIVQDYIYLRMNPEYNINALSVSGKECRECCQDSAGEDDKYFSKILLNGFGGFCRTAVQLPKQFNPILGKYETVSCQLVDRLGNQIVNTDCEYDFVLEITEITNTTTDGSSLIGPK